MNTFPPGGGDEPFAHKPIEKIKPDKEVPEKLKPEKEGKLEKPEKFEKEGKLEKPEKPEKEKREKEKLEIKEGKPEKEKREKEKIEIKEGKNEKELKNEKFEKNELKEVKIEIKEVKLEKIEGPEKEIDEIRGKEIVEAPGGGEAITPALDPNTLLQHAQNLEETGRTLRHFIERSMRPDLSTGALNNEEDLQEDDDA